MYSFFRSMIYLSLIGIFIFLSIRIFHVVKYRSESKVQLLLHKKYCFEEIKGQFPIFSYPDDQYCVIKGAFITPGIFHDRFYLPRKNQQDIEINTTYLVNFY